MFNLEKRTYFATVGELRALLSKYPDDTEITGFGGWFHVDNEENTVFIDSTPLNNYYDEDDDELEKDELEERRCNRDYQLYRRDYESETFFVNNKLMRIYLDEDDYWDYELYNINLTAVDTGTLYRGRDMTRNDIAERVLSRHNLEKAKRSYFTPTIGLEALCESEGNNL